MQPSDPQSQQPITAAAGAAWQNFSLLLCHMIATQGLLIEGHVIARSLPATAHCTNHYRKSLVLNAQQHYQLECVREKLHMILSHLGADLMPGS